MFSQAVRSVFVSLALSFPLLVGAGSWAGSQVGCTPEARHAVREALDLAQIACIFASQFTDEEAVMEACRIQRELRPLVTPLLSQKRAAQKAAACAPDAGAQDASDQ